MLMATHKRTLYTIQPGGDLQRTTKSFAQSTQREEPQKVSVENTPTKPQENSGRKGYLPVPSTIKPTEIYPHTRQSSSGTCSSHSDDTYRQAQEFEGYCTAQSHPNLSFSRETG